MIASWQEHNLLQNTIIFGKIYAIETRQYYRNTKLKPLKPGSGMARRICPRSVCSFLQNVEGLLLSSNIQRSDIKSSSVPGLVVLGSTGNWLLQVSRSYARASRQYDLFGKGKRSEKLFRRTWEQEKDKSSSLWSGSDEDDESDSKDNDLDEHVEKLKKEAEEQASLIDADDSDELRSVWSGSDEEKTLWTGSECDDDDDIPTEPHPHERSDPYIDKLFEFEEAPKYRSISELLKAENEPPELSPGKQARKIAVENALRKLKKGPDGRYTNVWEVMTDIDILIGAFENVASGPEYAELRQGGPKKLNMEFFKDIQAHMRDPKFEFSPEVKLKPKSKLVSRKRWQKARSRRRKAERR